MFFRLLIFTLIRLTLLIIGGVVISVFHDRDIIVALILAVGAGGIYFLKRKSPGRKLYFLGFILSAICGILAENFGIQSGLWTYHDLSGGREFPYWLPFAWALAFAVLYDFEKHYIRILKIKQLSAKILLTILATAFLPTIGEIVAVNMGVWTYVGDYKIFGIPRYAIGLLVVFHTGIFLLLYTINLRWKTPDPVFSSNFTSL